MKPPDEKVTRWLDEHGHVFMAAVEAELMRFAETFKGVKLTPSDRRTVLNRLFFDACKRSVKTADRRLKSSRGGANAAKKKKADADTRWGTYACLVAQNYVGKIVKAGGKPTRAGVIRAIRREGEAAGVVLPSTDEAIGNLVDAMRKEGKIKLEA